MICPVILLPLFFSLGGCALVHNEKPALAQTDIAKLRIAQIPQAALQQWPGSNWWHQYQNPQLNQLVEQALKDSPSVAVVQQRIVLAKAQTEMAKAQGGAQIDFGADVERQKMSGEGVMGPFAVDDPAAGTTGPWYTNGTFGLQGSYELDLWGKNRDQIQASLGVYQAKQAELAQTQLMVSSAVTELYWDIQTVMALQNVLQQVQEQQQRIVDTDATLYKQGILSSLDDAATKITLAKLAQNIDANNGELRTLQATLGAMMGLKQSLPSIKPVPLPETTGALPPAISYELLARRPDLQAAHWYIEASLSQVDAAKAAFYPSINLMGFLQYDALHLSDLFRSSAQQMGAIAGLTLPIFDSGRLNANLDIVQANSSLTIASYNKAIVGAVTDVVKSASQIQMLAQQNLHQQEVVGGEQHILDLTQQRFAAGLISENQVSKAKLPLLQEQANLLILKNKAINADISLITSLGGGYRATKNENIR